MRVSIIGKVEHTTFYDSGEYVVFHWAPIFTESVDLIRI